MLWEPAYGGAVLALRDHAGRIVATIDGPHPAGYLLTVFTPERSTSVHRTLDAAKDVGNFLHANAEKADRQGGVAPGNPPIGAPGQVRVYTSRRGSVG